MGVRGRPAVARNVLEYRQHATLLQTLCHRPRNGGDLAWFGSIGPLADNRVRAGHRHVGQWQTIDAYADITKIGRNQSRTQPGGSQPGGAVDIVEPAKHRSGWIDRPIGWAEALNPAA